MSIPYLRKAVGLVGGQVALAREMNIRMPSREKPLTQGHVWHWLNGMKGPTPPAEYVIPIVIAVNGGVTPHQLREDLYPDPLWMPKEVRQKAA